MFFYKSESQSSMKLLIRTYEQKPLILVWLLEPYPIMTNGVLKSVEAVGAVESESDENAPPLPNLHKIQSFCALKILYKIFDTQSAAS